jgi:hypothetical protein
MKKSSRRPRAKIKSVRKGYFLATVIIFLTAAILNERLLLNLVDFRAEI